MIPRFCLSSFSDFFYRIAGSRQRADAASAFSLHYFLREPAARGARADGRRWPFARLSVTLCNSCGSRAVFADSFGLIPGPNVVCLRLNARCGTLLSPFPTPQDSRPDINRFRLGLITVWQRGKSEARRVQKGGAGYRLELSIHPASACWGNLTWRAGKRKADPDNSAPARKYSGPGPGLEISSPSSWERFRAGK